MKIVLILAPLVVGLTALILTILVGGMLMPREHHATASVRLSKTPDAVWALIADPDKAHLILPEIKGIERLPPHDGHEMYKELGVAMGGDLTLEVMENDAPRRRVTRIANDNLPFGGTWTFELTPEATGTRLRITEDGFVKPAAFRYIGRIMGYDATIRKYLGGVAKHLGEPAALEG